MVTLAQLPINKWFQIDVYPGLLFHKSRTNIYYVHYQSNGDIEIMPLGLDLEIEVKPRNVKLEVDDG